MKSIFSIILLTVVTLFQNAVAAELTDEEKEYIAAFTPIAEIAQDSGISVRVAIIGNYSPKLTKVFMTYKDGQCVLGLNLRHDRTHFDPLDVDAPGVDRRQMLNTVLAHEMGHCFAATAAKIPNPKKEVSVEVHHEEERNADLFALAWIAIYNPEDFQAAMMYLKTIRGAMVKSLPDYNGATPSELAGAVRFKNTDLKSKPDFLTKVATGNFG